jgi:hypothetical protein
MKALSIYTEMQIAWWKMFSKQSPQTTKDLADILAIIKTNVRTADKVNDLTIKTATEFLTLLKILKEKGVLTSEESLKIIQAGKDA